MRKIKEVLRLRHELGLGQRQIARSCSIAQSTVRQYLKAAETAGVRWPLPADWDDGKLEEALFGGRPEAPPRRTLAAPDFAAVHQELQSHPHLTLQLLWEEYRQANAAAVAYRYSRFCELYRQWHRHLDVVLRQEHRAGEKLFVDYAGDTIPIGCGETSQAAELPQEMLKREPHLVHSQAYTQEERNGNRDLWIHNSVRDTKTACLGSLTRSSPFCNRPCKIG